MFAQTPYRGMAEAIDPWANGERLPRPPMTLGNTAAARVRLILWCKDCGHQVEPDPAEMAARVRRRNARARLAQAADLFPLRQPAGRSGGERD